MTKKKNGVKKALSVNFKTPFVAGNQYAKGCETSGRPCEIDYVAESVKLDEWAASPEAYHLYTFVKDKRYCAQDLTDFAKRSAEFALSLRRAKESISFNRERLVSEGKLHPTAFNRSISLYDRPLYEHEEAIKDRQAERDRGVKAQADANLASLISDARDGKIKQDEEDR